MKITFDGASAAYGELDCFDLARTLSCGQCFRFKPLPDGEWEGVARNRYIRLRQEGATLTVNGVGSEAEAQEWAKYFDLERNYSAILEKLSSDGQLCDAAKRGRGIRILAQEPWEALCSFIISQNNNIPRIMKIVASLCALFGDDLGDGHYSFPDAGRIAQAGADGLASIRAGFRAKYIADAARKVSDGEISFDMIHHSTSDQAAAELKKIYGVGDKVAACTLLYGFGMLDVFPVDVWVKRVIAKYYGDSFDASCFSPYAGIAQQYLFFRERSLTSCNT
ncbi:MAG TPA: DNA glycosylase [Bacillota bacterium]|nr:DNA glycosylase [Bacillota bacterium]